MKLSEYLKEKRKAAGYTQSTLAKEFGFTGQFIARWEMGESDPPLYLVRELAEVLRIPEDEFIEKILQEKVRKMREKIYKRVETEFF